MSVLFCPRYCLWHSFSTKKRTIHGIIQLKSWDYVSSPVAFLITTTALSRQLFALRLHLLDTYNQWQTSKQDEKHQCRSLRLQLSTGNICTQKHLGINSKVSIKDFLKKNYTVLQGLQESLLKITNNTWFQTKFYISWKQPPKLYPWTHSTIMNTGTDEQTKRVCCATILGRSPSLEQTAACCANQRTPATGEGSRTTGKDDALTKQGRQCRKWPQLSWRNLNKKPQPLVQ